MSTLAKLASSVIIPTRSKYQLEKFVIGQHDTPQMRYQQLLIEGADMAFKIRTAELQIKKSLLEIAALKRTGNELDAVEAEIQEANLGMTRLALESAKYEFAALEELFAQYPEFTYADIEADQPTYWAKRLNRQAELDVAQIREGVSAGNLQSMLNAGLFEAGKELGN